MLKYEPKINYTKPKFYGLNKYKNFSTTRVCYADSEDPFKSLSDSLDTLRNSMNSLKESRVKSVLKERTDLDETMYQSNLNLFVKFHSLKEYYSPEFISKFNKDNYQTAEVIRKFNVRIENLKISGASETEINNIDKTRRKLFFNMTDKQFDAVYKEVHRVTDGNATPEQQSVVDSFLNSDKEKRASLSKENDALISREKNLIGSNEGGSSSFTAANCPLEKEDSSSILMYVFKDLKQQLKTIIPYELLFVLQAILVIYRIYILLKKVYKWLTK